MSPFTTGATTPSEEGSGESRVEYNLYVGLGLAISSSIFIGASFIIKKKGLLRISSKGQTRAGSGGYSYLKEWVWWAGLISMGIGEAANFTAYAFAPASLVTPLGALSVLVSAVLSSKFLNEKLNLLGKIGCFLCVLGSTVIVLHSPKEGAVDSMEKLQHLILGAGFLIYVILVVLVTIILITFCVPKYGTTNVTIYVVICSVIGSLSVMACKGLGLALRESIGGYKNEFATFLPWFCLFSVIVCIAIQMNYLNKALDTFNTSVVTPVYYVFFTTFVIIASSILFREWATMLPEDIVGNLCGFFTIICAIFLLNAFRDWDISLTNLNSILQKRENSQLSSYSTNGNSVNGNGSGGHSCTRRNNETTSLLERHSRQNSLETSGFSKISVDDIVPI